MDKRRDGSPLLESAIEAYLQKRMKQVGGRAYKFPPAVKGAPDRIVAFPFGRIYFVELKRKGQKPEPAQEYWHNRSLAMGHVVHVLDSREMVDAFISWVFANDVNVKEGSERRYRELVARDNGYKEETE